MLSLLIPTYNRDCTPLVCALLRQEVPCDREIVVMDDASTAPIAEQNRAIASWEHCRYIRLERNVSRAEIRNRLVAEARGDRLLFLDDDVLPVHPDMLRRYLAAEADVVCGGVVAALEPHPDNLRWVYDHAAANKRNAQWRTRHPYDNFASSAFCIKREALQHISFNQDITLYGYEDALFGLDLHLHGLAIAHVEAPVEHLGLDTNPVFLHKTEQALQTLHRLPQLHRWACVSRLCLRLQRLRLTPLIRLFHHLFSPLLRRNLTGSHPSAFLLQLYKLGHYASL